MPDPKRNAPKPVKPRGRNGGRRPTIDPGGRPTVGVNVRVPAWAAAVLDSIGPNRSAAARRAILPALKQFAAKRKMPVV